MAVSCMSDVMIYGVECNQRRLLLQLYHVEKVDGLKIGMGISVRRNIVVPVPTARYCMVKLHLQLPVDRFSAQKGEKWIGR